MLFIFWNKPSLLVKWCGHAHVMQSIISNNVGLCVLIVSIVLSHLQKESRRRRDIVMSLIQFLHYHAGVRVAQWVKLDYLITHTSPSPIWRGFPPSFVNYKKGCTRLAAASDKVYQLLARGRWFSPGTPASSTTKTGCHDIAEILLKVALNTINQIK